MASHGPEVRVLNAILVRSVSRTLFVKLFIKINLMIYSQSVNYENGIFFIATVDKDSSINCIFSSDSNIYFMFKTIDQPRVINVENAYYH